MRVRLSRFLNSAHSCFPILFAQAGKSTERKTQATESGLSGQFSDVFTDVWVWLFIILLVVLLGVFFYVRNKKDDDD
jgi:hypothetical protein